MNHPDMPLDETLARQQIAEEIRGEFAEQLNAEVTDERTLALAAIRFWKTIGAVVGLLIGLPALGFSTGAAVRLFFWASGLGS